MAQNYVWPAVSVTATNPSVSTNGTTIPGSSTLVAGENPTGNQQPLQTNSAGSLLVAPTPGTTGDVNLIEVGGAAVSLGQKLESASIPVVLASDEVVPISASALPLPAGASTSALQTSGNSSLTSILANQTNGTQITQVSSLPSIPAGANAIGSVSVSNFPATQPVSGTLTVIQPTAANLNATVTGTVAVSSVAGSVAVTGTFFQATQPVSAASLPLPSGASTSANQSTIITNTANLSRLSGSLVPTAFDEIDLTYTGSNVTTAVYKLATVTVKTLTLTYTGSNLTSVVAS